MTNKEDLIWYVCYGSNLCYERFMCYLTDEENKKLHIKKYEGSHKTPDKSAPRKSLIIEIPYEMYFGFKMGTTNWGDSGVCFLRRNENPNAHTVARAYLITKDQYKHVWYREGTDDSWYGHEIPLGFIGDIKAATFTSSFDIEEGLPCKDYLDVLKLGLSECGKSEEFIEQYLKERGVR